MKVRSSKRSSGSITPTILVPSRLSARTEALALARAVRWHSERRVMLNEHSTVVFR